MKPLKLSQKEALTMKTTTATKTDWQRALTIVISMLACFVFGLILLGAWSVAKGEPQQVFRDARGNTIGTATQSGNQTTFRDSRGSTTGTATTDSQGTTTFRNSRGSVTGTTTAPFGARR